METIKIELWSGNDNRQVIKLSTQLHWGVFHKKGYFDLIIMFVLELTDTFYNDFGINFNKITKFGRYSCPKF